MKKSIAVPIIPRKMSFDFTKTSTQDWCCQNMFYSAYMNGVSLALPLGEDFFIRAIRQFDGQVNNPILEDELKRFVAQEAIHSRQHLLYNNQLTREGYDINNIQTGVQQALDEVWETSTPMERLAYTIALEHLTHVLGDQILANSQRLSGWHAEFRAFWLWHAAEEIEHKAVCYDLYQQLGGTLTMRSKALFKMTQKMLSIFWQNQHDLLSQTCKLRGISMPSNLMISRANIRFLFDRQQGLLRGAEPAYLAWFLPAYHPWKHDNRSALTLWQRDVLPLNHIADLKMA